MRSRISRALAAIAASWALGAAAAGSNTYTDLWWNPQQSGWGANIAQQGDIAFVTLYVHGPDGRPTWYFAPDARKFATDAAGLPAFHGPLYTANGPWFGGPFDPGSVTTRLVGSLVIEPRGGGELYLEYDVDGVTISRTIRRFTFAQPDLGGSYNAAFTLRVAPTGEAPTGTREFRARVEASLDGSTFSMLVVEDIGYCLYDGAYRPSGRMGAVTGRYQCASGNGGTFSIDDVEATEHGLSGYLRMHGEGAEQYGRFAGARR
jgi:hypothetical protein